jgi:hypothetical protein
MVKNRREPGPTLIQLEALRSISRTLGTSPTDTMAVMPSSLSTMDHMNHSTDANSISHDGIGYHPL